ncbi:Na+/H+ antiporter subunit A [Thermomonospora umbrina]|uniref:Multisubunit sodium/proton antiporter MrpA subunit /multisubunit sodium/proton antiporter MrpB subunit n=1 Tax=Thermomonospora umbrina TaxID=111806 RepID=A0A3D9SQ53_9ACTN|nr:Na+/H+ antiporter subunit A [Thermomonospora umbrina]REE97747.1 multisubunit sodium/proton antiporter MrpA subunit /multisubunit sodium/proton antiporter MrpB subunit [Thermomonospora umbrina]
MLMLVVFHAAVALVLPWGLGHSRRGMAYVAALAPLATLVWAVRQAASVRDAKPVVERTVWAADLGLVLDFRLDGLAWVLLLLVGGVGALVLVYSAWYFTSPARMTVSVLVAFAGAMTGLVLADNLLVLYVFWELTTLCSYLLIGGEHPENAANRRAANQALLMTTGFGLVMLAGLVILGLEADTYTISAILADPPEGGAVQAALLLILLGAFAKSAQMPLHSWLPAAMVAPTPVSAYLHAAAMVQGGVYLVARLAPGFAEVWPWRPLVVIVGLVSLIVAGWQALWQDDLKRLLAYGTVSQLGLLMVLCGAGTRTAALAGLALLLAHGLFKAPMFLAVGAVDHTYGTRRASELHGVGRRMPMLALAGVAATASMVGLPPFLGFVAKEAALEAFAHGGVDLLVLLGVAAGSVFTVAYGVRFLTGTFGGRRGERHRRLPAAALGPIVFLAGAGFVAGFMSGTWQGLIGPYAGLLPADDRYELSLWHGLGVPLLFSVLILASGVWLYVRRERFRPWQERWERLPTAQQGYCLTVNGLFRVAHAVTRRVQVGSLPAYLAVIVLTVLVVPGLGLVWVLARGEGPAVDTDRLELWDHPVQLPLGVIVACCAFTAMRVHRRLSAALLLGGAGYGVVGLFVVHGAPDLALTSLVVETLTLIILVFVLRRLPERFPPRRRLRPARILSAVISTGVGAFMATFLVVAVLSRDHRPVGPRYAQEAKEEGANNVVDAILADLRALDTLGEISVLAVAAVGVAALVLTGMRDDRLGHAAVPETDETPGDRRSRWLTAPGRPPLGGRSLPLAVATRLVVPSVLVFSVYLLFAGHGQPGGGFVGGLVAGTAFVMRYLAGGLREVVAAVPFHPALFIGGGLAIALATGAGGWLVGDSFLEATALQWDWPLLGHVKLPTSLFFDLGVYVVVFGLILSLIRTLGTSLEEHPENGERGRA